MTNPQDARDRIMATLRDHFGATDQHLSPEDVAAMTGLDLAVVRNSLRVLHEMDQIKGITVAEINYPLQVTSVVW